MTSFLRLRPRQTQAITDLQGGRIEFRVDDNFVAAVNDLAARTHKSKAEVLRDAVNLYYKAVNEWEENGRGIVFQSIQQQ
jgi:hypothetical protein